MLKINRKLQSPFLGPFLALSQVNSHNFIIQNLRTNRTKLVHVDRLRLAKPDSVSKHLGTAGSNKAHTSAESHVVKNSTASTSSSVDKSFQSEPSNFVEFDLKNDVAWFKDGPMPQPIVIKTENLPTDCSHATITTKSNHLI